MDRLFPVKPDMPEPSWTRVIGLIITMTVIWEIIWFVTYYLSGPTAHNVTAAWNQTAQFLPFAVLFAALGAIPGFWLMRSRIRRVRQRAEQERAQQRALAHQKPSTPAASNRARKRQMTRRHGSGRH